MKNHTSLTLSYDTLASRCSWILFAVLLLAVSLFVSSLAEKDTETNLFQNKGFRVVSECMGVDNDANKILFADHAGSLHKVELLAVTELDLMSTATQCRLILG